MQTTDCEVLRRELKSLAERVLKRGPAKLPTHVGQAILQGKSAKDV